MKNTILLFLLNINVCFGQISDKLPSFDEVVIMGRINVEIKEFEQNRITSNNGAKQFHYFVEKGRLFISGKSIEKDTVHVTVFCTKLRKLELSGHCRVSAMFPSKMKGLEIGLQNHSVLTGIIRSSSMTITANESKISLEGSVDELRASASNKASLSLLKLITRNSNITAKESDVSVFATDQLKANLQSARLSLEGQPKRIYRKMSPDSKLINL